MVLEIGLIQGEMGPAAVIWQAVIWQAAAWHRAISDSGPMSTRVLGVHGRIVYWRWWGDRVVPVVRAEDVTVPCRGDSYP
ncbi:hypothetical protein [Protofrankia sp. BMG5.30]|uniref:hypothetical protein n=1 Tax=Protofrankia sp. BMG5.30 TaxID=1834514 RepID=UPI000A475923|nr:hypothetical protein [Protofrankia sp. BMG5.30]